MKHCIIPDQVSAAKSVSSVFGEICLDNKVQIFLAQAVNYFNAKCISRQLLYISSEVSVLGNGVRNSRISKILHNSL